MNGTCLFVLACSRGNRDVDDAHGVGVEAAIPEGIREKSKQFEALGGKIYHEALLDNA